MSLEIQRIRAICFDIDGTLSDTDDLWVQRLGKTLAPVKFFLPNRQTEPFARWVVMGAESPGNMMYSLLDRMNLDADVGRLYEAISKFRPSSRQPRVYKIVPDVREALQLINGRYPMSIVSARDQNGTHAFLNQYELFPMFHSIATSQTCHHTKPYPDPVLWAAQQMGVLPEACLMVGDSSVDIRAGRAAGAQTVGVLCGFGTEKELRRAGADLIIPSTAYLPEVLFGKQVLPG
ncbi:MAG: HAD family hydrolase [Anaerolineaceae bacterium]|nr:HAD family hydrolase [Anaerolineaceae bacterium]